MDTTVILWTGIGAAALIFAFIEYRLSFKKRIKLEKINSGDKVKT